MNCPKCQTEIAAGVKFCPECGQKLGSTIGDDVSLGGLKTVAGGISLGQMPTQISPARPAGGSGQRLGERYEVIAEIGRGGFAVVYRARDLKLGREVAVKRLQAAATLGAMGQQVLERFEREAHSIAALNHRNIVLVYDSDRDAAGAYVVMEHVDGGSLRDLLKSKGGKLAAAEALELIKGVAKGLAYAHRKNLVHRDIKPANILLAKEGGELVPKIVDFGLARMGGESELSMSGIGMGTPWYMPPEQRRNAKGVNHTADLYALGKTLYELVTGEVPDSVEAEKLPAWLRPIIQRCIKNNPEERYFSAEDLLKDLEKPGVNQVTPAAAKPALADQCPACGTVNGEAEKYCKQCGGGLNKPCPECGREQRSHIRYCGACGTDVPAFEKAADIVAAMKRHALAQKPEQVYADFEQFSQGAFRPKGSKGRELASEAERINSETKTAERQKIEAAKAAEQRKLAEARAAEAEARAAKQRQQDELQAIQALRRKGEFEAALTRLKDLKAMTVDWGAVEEELRLALPLEWAATLEPQARKLLAEQKPEEAWKQLALLESLTGKLDEAPARLRDEAVALWAAKFQEEFQALLQAGQYDMAFWKLANTSWVANVGDLLAAWSEAFGQHLAQFEAAGQYAKALAEAACVEKLLAQNPVQPETPAEQTPQARLAGLLRQLEWPQKLAALKAGHDRKQKQVVAWSVGALAAACFIGLAIWWLVFHLPEQRRIEQARQQAQQEEAARVQAQQQAQQEEAARVQAQQREEAARQVRIGETVMAATKDNPFVNSLGMKFVPVAGTAVLFGVWDVRVKDYAAYARVNSGVDNRWQNPGYNQGEDHPVVKVSWNDAKAFCEWLTRKEQAEGKISSSQSYRLPRESEWNVAVGNTKYPWGEQWPPPSGAGNYCGQETQGKYGAMIDNYSDGYVNTSPVGSFSANRYGLYDMGGNVSQWCEYEYSFGSRTGVWRGASWNDDDPDRLLSSYRNFSTSVNRYDFEGFRCVLVDSSSR